MAVKPQCLTEGSGSRKHAFVTTFNVLHTEWSNGWGGQEIRIWDECLGMVQRGHRVELAGCPDGKLRKRCEADGLVFHPLPMAGPWDLSALMGLRSLIKRGGFNIVHTHSSVDSWLGGMAAPLAGAACIRTRHLSVKVNTNPLNIVYKLPRAVITTGEAIRRHLVEDYGLPARRVVSIPTGVDTGRYSPGPPDPELYAEFGIEPGSPVVAYVAVLRSWKRHDLFCKMAGEIAARHPETRFIIAGDGPIKDQIVKQLDEMKLRPRVVMTGHREDVERILRLCTVCVLLSDKAEGVSQAVLQELSAERAVVGSDAGATAEIVRHEKTGLLVPPGRLEPVVAAVERLLDDPALARSLGKAGRKMVLAQYGRDAMLEATEAVYVRALAGDMAEGA